MPSLPYPLRHLLLLLTLTLAGTSCQSSRPAFLFPAAASSRAAKPVLEVPDQKPLGASRVAVLPKAAVAPSAPAAVVTLTPSARQSVGRPQPVRRAQLSGLRITSDQVSTNKNGKMKRLTQVVARLHHQTLAPAENGLGSAFIGILGIVALLVGLIGLIFAGWGFFGWLAIAGAVGLLISILAPYISGYN